MRNRTCSNKMTKKTALAHTHAQILEHPLQLTSSPHFVLNLLLKALLLTTVALSIASLTGCESPTPNSVEAENSHVDVERPARYNPERLVCDPFGNTGAGRDTGLFARLHYLTSDQPRYSKVDDYYKFGHKFDADLFFSQLNVPTRPFDRGFITDSGSLLQTPAGDTLYEWFSLHFRANVVLSSHENAGKYQFALLSDDGANLYTDLTTTGEFVKKIIDNDGTHPSKLKCANQSFYFDHNTRMPIKLDYYQGPRYHVSLILLWREIPANVDEVADPSVLADPACGLSGNSTFFDFNQNPPQASPVWLGLIRRGWRVLSANNYLLPAAIPSNPCNPDGGPGNGGDCGTDVYPNPTLNTFALSNSAPDASTFTVKLTVDGVVSYPTYVYDPVLNAVYIPSVQPNLGQVVVVEIRYCPRTCTGLGCGSGGIGV